MFQNQDYRFVRLALVGEPEKDAKINTRGQKKFNISWNGNGYNIVGMSNTSWHITDLENECLVEKIESSLIISAIRVDEQWLLVSRSSIQPEDIEKTRDYILKYKSQHKFETKDVFIDW